MVKKLAKYAKICILMFCVIYHKLSTQGNAIASSYWQWKQVYETIHQSSELFNSVFLRVTLVVATTQ